MSPSVDILWVLFCSALVFLMQAGFLMLESGFTRNKNNINVAIKNISDFGVSTLVFWAFGYALMFGHSFGSWVGLDDFFVAFHDNTEQIVFFTFQVMFCGTAVTIVSGAIAERVRFGAYMVVSIVVAGFIYPIFGHWAWNGIDVGTASGWLNQIGFVDFAGSTVVHSVGGWVALAILLVIGPRSGRFPKNKAPQTIPASNLMIATTGVMLLWFGWFGFNGGSSLALNDIAIRALINTVIAGSAGLGGALILSYIVYQRADVSMLLNGTLAGLVGITANAHSVSLGSAVIIGAVAVVFMFICDIFLNMWHIDDAVGAVPVHLGAGVWGTLAVGLFGDLSLLGTGLDRLSQIGVQVVGIITCGVWTFFTVIIVVTIVNIIFKLRVTEDDEAVGLNISEHNARTDLIDVLEAMDKQARVGDLSLRVPVEPFTEVGRIASRHNRVIASLEQAIAHTDSIVRTSLDGIVTFSSVNLVITAVNPAAQDMFHYTESKIIGQPIALLFDTRLQDFVTLVYDLVTIENAVELIGVRSNGETFPVEVAITRFQQADAMYYTASFRDISERKQAEKEHQKLRELELKAEAALENSRIKSEFLSTMSHELRTPLNALIGYTGMLLMGVRGKIDDDARDVITSLEESGKHLLALVNDILDIEKIESGHFRLDNHPIVVERMVRGWIDHTRILADQKGLNLQMELDPRFPKTIISDQERLTQIVLNLLSNAIKFTPEGTVNLCIRHLGQQWQIEVTDTGIGIADYDKDIIFEKFRQADGSSSRQYGGTGLGLSIVMQLANVMGGDISLDSQLDQGSKFTVTLPLVQPV